MSWFDLPPLIQNTFLTLASVSALILLVQIVRKPFATRFGAKAAYTLWLLPGLRLVAPPLPADWSLLAKLNQKQTVWAEAALAEPSRQLPAYQPGRSDPSTIWSGTEAPLALPSPVQAPADLAMPLLSQAALTYLVAGLLVIWAAGAIVWIARAWHQQHQFRTLIDMDSAPASAAIRQMAESAAQKIGVRCLPELRVSLLCSSPLITGLTAPIILLPMWFEEDYTRAEQQDTLIHELTHLKRRDLWAFQLARMIAATQWFNPLIGAGLRAFRTDQEAACDADVLRKADRSPADYGRTLVKAVRLSRPSDQRIAAASLTLAHPIKERLIMMTYPTPSRNKRLFGAGLAFALGAATLYATASSLSQAQETQAEETQTPSEAAPDAASPSEKLSRLTLELDGKTLDIMLPDLPPLPPFPDIPDMPGLAVDQHANHFSLHLDTDALTADPEALAEFEARMSEWGEQMEAWGEAVERQAEKWAETNEPGIEAWAETHARIIEGDVEKWAELIAARAEQAAEGAAHHLPDAADLEGKAEERVFDVSTYNQIEVGSGIRLIYTQAEETSVKAYLKGGSWKDVEIKTVSDTLKIRRKTLFAGARKPMQLTVYASSDDLKALSAASGAHVKGRLNADNFRLEAASGALLSLEGDCDRITIDAASGAFVKLGRFKCQTASIEASSGASVHAHAAKSVKAEASGGASVVISGTPAEIEKEISGGASIRKG